MNWVRSSDYLPIPNVIVLVQGGIAIHDGKIWRTLTCCEWPGKPIIWEVTHWSLLPTPPIERQYNYEAD